MLTVSPIRPSFITTALLALAMMVVAIVAALTPALLTPTTVTPNTASLDRLPLAFIPNQGQYAAEIQLQAQGKSSTLQFLQNEVVLHLPSDPAVHLQWEGANQSPSLVAGEPLGGVMNVMHGNDPAAWHTNIPLVAGVTYDNLYPGINLTYDGNEGTLKGTYTVAPRADASQIRWQFHGTSGATVNAETGDLHATLPSGKIITEKAPIAWQTVNGVQHAVAVQYAVEGEIISFTFPNGYDATLPLIIDPTLLYSTYLGGSSTDEASAVTFDSAGNIYITGVTQSDDLLGYNTTPSGYSDIFVTKLNPTGTTVLYMSIVGSPDSESARAIDVHGNNAYVSVFTTAENFPVVNALWETLPNYWDAGALFKLDATGELVYSTYLPLDNFDATDNLAVDSAGNAYITGAHFGATDPDGNSLGNQVGLYKISPDGSEVLLEKNYGSGNAHEFGIALTLDVAGNIYIAGKQNEGDKGEPFGTPNAHQPECGDIVYGDNFYCYEDTIVYVLNPAGEMTYGSYHGGSFTDEPSAIATDGHGNILIAGDTTSGHFPLVNALQTTCPLDSNQEDCNTSRGYVSVIHIDPVQSTMVYSTYWGAPERDSNNHIAAATMDSTGNAYVVGYTNGRQFPMKDPVQAQLNPSFCSTLGSERYCFDAFVTKFTLAGQLAFSTYFGATFDEFPYDITLDNNGNMVFVGLTEASDFQTTADAIQPDNSLNDDGFLVKIGTGTTPPPTTATPTTPPSVTPGGPTMTPSPTVTPGGPTVTPTVTTTPNPNLKKTFLPIVLGRGN